MSTRCVNIAIMQLAILTRILVAKLDNCNNETSNTSSSSTDNNTGKDTVVILAIILITGLLYEMIQCLSAS